MLTTTLFDVEHEYDTTEIHSCNERNTVTLLSNGYVDPVWYYEYSRRANNKFITIRPPYATDLFQFSQLDMQNGDDEIPSRKDLIFLRYGLTVTLIKKAFNVNEKSDAIHKQIEEIYDLEKNHFRLILENSYNNIRIIIVNNDNTGIQDAHLIFPCFFKGFNDQRTLYYDCEINNHPNMQCWHVVSISTENELLHKFQFIGGYKLSAAVFRNFFLPNDKTIFHKPVVFDPKYPFDFDGDQMYTLLNEMTKDLTYLFKNHGKISKKCKKPLAVPQDLYEIFKKSGVSVEQIINMVQGSINGSLNFYRSNPDLIQNQLYFDPFNIELNCELIMKVSIPVTHLNNYNGNYEFGLVVNEIIMDDYYGKNYYKGAAVCGFVPVAFVPCWNIVQNCLLNDPKLAKYFYECELSGVKDVTDYIVNKDSTIDKRLLWFLTMNSSFRDLPRPKKRSKKQGKEKQQQSNAVPPDVHAQQAPISFNSNYNRAKSDLNANSQHHGQQQPPIPTPTIHNSSTMMNNFNNFNIYNTDVGNLNAVSNSQVPSIMQEKAVPQKTLQSQQHVSINSMMRPQTVNSVKLNHDSSNGLINGNFVDSNFDCEEKKIELERVKITKQKETLKQKDVTNVIKELRQRIGEIIRDTTKKLNEFSFTIYLKQENKIILLQLCKVYEMDIMKDYILTTKRSGDDHKKDELFSIEQITDVINCQMYKNKLKKKRESKEKEQEIAKLKTDGLWLVFDAIKEKLDSNRRKKHSSPLYVARLDFETRKHDNKFSTWQEIQSALMNY